MKEQVKRIKMDVIVTAFVCIGLGIVLTLWPIEVTMAVCRIIGAVIAFLGAARMFGYVTHRGEKHSVHLLPGLALLLVGIWIVLNPHSIQSILFIGIGTVLFVHGLEDFKFALEAKENGYESWAVLVLMALLGMAFGILCIIDCFGVISVTLSFAGLVLIYDGITDLWIVSRMVRTAKALREKIEATLREEDAEDVKEESELNGE